MGAARMRKHLTRITVVACLAVALGAVTAAARTASTHFVAGNLIVDLGFSFAPTTLPLAEYAPIEGAGFAKLRTKDGSVPPPLTHLLIEADKSSKVETRGLPTCTKAKLVATTTAQARRACPDAIVGTGFGSGVIVFPEQAPISAGSPITFFNGPEVGGDPTLIVHAHLDVPAPTTYLVPVRIERVDKGPIGYRVESKIPKIAGGYGSVTDFKFEFDRSWRFEDERLSYLNARCAHPGPHLLGHVGAQFVDGTDVHGSLFTSCQVR